MPQAAKKLREAILAFLGTKCAYCKSQSAKLEIDHKVPLCLGGKNKLSNLQPLCPRCHKIKTRTEKLYALTGQKRDKTGKFTTKTRT